MAGVNRKRRYTMEHNFIVASLCDNDFGYDLMSALKEGIEEYGYEKKLCPVLWKKFLIAFILGKILKSSVGDSVSEEFDYSYLKHIEDYLRKGLRVTFEKTAPTDDHDGGSAVIDLHTKQAWIY